MRELSERELKVLRKAINFYNSFDFLSNFKILAREKELFAVSKDLHEFLSQRELECIAGVKIGEIGKRLRLTLEGSFWLMKNEKKKVWVNEHGEMLFLYGRDIFAGSITKVGEFDENEVVFVCNEFGDILGIGRSRFKSSIVKELPKDRVFIENLVDRGAYIRHNKLYESF
ncbi:MAG: ribosome subunit biosis protein [Archaeoglobaceae archaeon]|nr:ribosome subunit biosis protein [Archaeoglobaceae archaeon]